MTDECYGPLCLHVMERGLLAREWGDNISGVVFTAFYTGGQKINKYMSKVRQCVTSTPFTFLTKCLHVFTSCVDWTLFQQRLDWYQGPCHKNEKLFLHILKVMLCSGSPYDMLTSPRMLNLHLKWVPELSTFLHQELGTSNMSFRIQHACWDVSFSEPLTGNILYLKHITNRSLDSLISIYIKYISMLFF